MDFELSVKGLKELDKQLENVSRKLAAKAIRQAALQATTPAYRQMKLAAPIGSREHKTYKGRLVTPGFLKRSIKRKTFVSKNSVFVLIGVLPEAYYGVTFLDDGTQTIGARKWFVKSFENKTDEIVKRFREVLAKKIQKL